MCIFVCGEMRERKSTRWVYCLTYESPWSWSCHSSKTLRFVRLSMTLGINTKMPGHRTHKVLQIFGHEPGRFVRRAWKFATECDFLFVCTGYFLFFWSCHQQSLCSSHFFASLFLQTLCRKEFWSRLLRKQAIGHMGRERKASSAKRNQLMYPTNVQKGSKFSPYAIQRKFRRYLCCM